VLDDSYHIVTVDRQRHLVVERTAAFVANLAKTITGKASGRVATTASNAA
jgi:carboxylesterase